ncbi:hypothetical protein NC652_010108 [Populus alba x Populus x berolinensis]|nr:hypothetical protein NC652_010108 [Populus alba x Populus x berolinensis]
MIHRHGHITTIFQSSICFVHGSSSLTSTGGGIGSSTMHFLVKRGRVIVGSLHKKRLAIITVGYMRGSLQQGILSGLELPHGICFERRHDRWTRSVFSPYAFPTLCSQ